MRTLWLAALLFLPAYGALAEEGGSAPALLGVPPQHAQAFLAREEQLASIPDVGHLARWHEAFTAQLHPAGSEGERQLAAELAQAFEGMGLTVEREPLDVYLPSLTQAQVQVLGAQGAVQLPLRERTVAEDAAVRTHTPPGWNAWSASGTAEGEVVYANRGLKADFERLAAQGVQVQDRIVIARYGGSFRGMKAFWAQAAGAAGLLLFTDPADDGYARGLGYPEGGYANETSIQRGAVVALDWPGDVLTPGRSAHPDAQREDPESVPLPRIPVQPLGWAAAQEILGRMRGPEVRNDWQGGLPLRYRVTGGPELRVRIHVEQPRRQVRVENIVGILRGATEPEHLVIVGCHYDAWTHGAGDPHAGSIVLFEVARAFAQLAKEGKRPARTLVFANWAAEEFGIIGSTEWVEARRAQLMEHGVAYLNLDMAAMGPNFSCAASPLLEQVIEEAARRVPQARDSAGRCVAQVWGESGPFRFGDLGGGSDHVAFQAFAGVPSFALHAGGSRGVSYHTAYDTLEWYRKVVGDYEPALMLARLATRVVHRLANAPVLPYSPERYDVALKRHAKDLQDRASTLGREALLKVQGELSLTTGLGATGAALGERLAQRFERGELSAAQLAALNVQLLRLERCWLHEAGLPGRSWWKSLYGAPDPDSGYAAWMLPWLRLALEQGTPDLFQQGVRALATAQERFAQTLDQIRELAR